MPSLDDRLSIAGLPVDGLATLADLAPQLRAALAMVPRQPWLVTHLNPASLSVARRNPQFVQMLGEFQVVAPDGIGVVLAARLLYRRRIARISFDTTSLAPLVFRLAAESAARVALVGGAPGVAKTAADHLSAAFEGLRIVGSFNGYGDRAATIQKVMRTGPEIVICGMGAPNQEAFILELRDNGWTGLGFTCGGYLDQLAGGLDYYPLWIDRFDLRWAYRLVREPRRLWRRYMLDYPVFVRQVMRDYLRTGDESR